QQWRVQVDFTTHPVGEQLRPAHTRIKPHTHGPQTALVVGPEDQNLWTDELGRIKVQFPWDRIGQKNQHSSCWVRVSGAWAGNQLGSIHIPRIGQEVVIDFIGGDPDLPLCTGRVANAVNLPPWKLPEQSALSGFRSRELDEGGGNSAAGRSNHLVMDDTAGQIQVQLKSDHQHSSLSLGHITRIEDHQGRKDQRGDGFELRTDGHGVARAAEGLLISTEGHEQAQAHAKDMGETVQRLEQAQQQHEMLEDLAVTHGAWDELEQSQSHASISQSLKAQNDALRGNGQADRAKGTFPELDDPHLLLASAAGIQASASGNIALDAQEHIAITSGGHASVAAKKSVLMSALKGLRLFAYQGGVRMFARKGAVQIQSHDDKVQLVAQRMLQMLTHGEATLKARKGIVLQAQGSTLYIDQQGFRFYTPNGHQVWAAGHGTHGPQTRAADLPDLPRSVSPGSKFPPSF
ncbi:type VI secretion system Vgr family protein, partial [Variovorax dokdonensis]